MTNFSFSKLTLVDSTRVVYCRDTLAPLCKYVSYFTSLDGSMTQYFRPLI
jgi:hypothetical protein